MRITVLTGRKEYCHTYAASSDMIFIDQSKTCTEQLFSQLPRASKPDLSGHPLSIQRHGFLCVLLFLIRNSIRRFSEGWLNIPSRNNFGCRINSLRI
jgi:hypothetical protein